MTNLNEPVLIVSPHIWKRVQMSRDIKWVGKYAYCDGMLVVRSYHVFDEENCPGIKMLSDMECEIDVH